MEIWNNGHRKYKDELGQDLYGLGCNAMRPWLTAKWNIVINMTVTHRLTAVTVVSKSCISLQTGSSSMPPTVNTLQQPCFMQ